MKKILAILLAILTVASALLMSACGNTQNPAGDPTVEPTTSPTETPTADPTATPEPENYVTVKEFLAALSSSPYTSTEKTEDCVITDSTVVGVNKDKYDNEMMYPFPETYDHTYIVTDYGMSIDKTGQENGKALNDLLKSLATVEGTKHVVFPVGTYKLTATISISGVDDLYISSDKTGETFNLVYTAWMHAMQITGCTNVSLRDYTLDYDPSSAVAGVITSYDMVKSQVTVRINDEFDLTKPCYNGGVFHSTHSYIEFAWDDATQAYAPDFDGNLKYDYDSVNGCQGLGYNAETKEMTLKLNSMKEPKIGAHVSIAFTEHQNFGLSVSKCDSLTLENVYFYHTCGMGLGISSIGEVRLNHFRIDLKPGSSRLMTCTADGLHSTDVQKLTVTNCAFKYTHDDALNVKSWYKEVKAIMGNTITCFSASANYPMEVGQEVEIFDTSDFHLVGAYTITKIMSSDGSSYKIKVDGTVGDGSTCTGYVLANTSRGTRLTFRNNLVGNKRNRGIMVQCRDSVIENNCFFNIVHGTLCIYTIRDGAKEGICPKNITVKNNKFLQNATDICGYTWGDNARCNYVMRNIYIYDNFFANSKNSAISVSDGFGDSEIHNNIFFDCVKNPSSDFAAIAVYHSKNVKVEKNVTYESVARKGANAYLAGTTNDNVTFKGTKLVKLDK